MRKSACLTGPKIVPALALSVLFSIIPCAAIHAQGNPAGDRLELALQDGHSDSVLDFGYSADGSWLVSLGRDKTIRIWRSSDQACFATVGGFGDFQTRVAVSLDGARFAIDVYDDDKRINILRIYSIPRGAVLKEIESPGRDFAAIAFSPDGRRILGGTPDGILNEYDATSGTTIRKTAGHGDSIAACAYAPDGKTFACVTSDLLASSGLAKRGTEGVDPCVKIWDAATGKLLRQARLSGPAESCAVSPDGSTIAVCSKDPDKKADGLLCLFRYADLSPIARLAGVNKGYCFAPAGDRLYVCTKDSIQVWDPSTGALAPFKAFNGQVFTRLALVPGRSAVAVAMGNVMLHGDRVAATSVRELELASGAISKTFRGRVYGSASVRFSPDGSYFASLASDWSRLDIWSLPDCAHKRSIAAQAYDRFECFDISADGRTIIAVRSGDIALIDPRTGALRRTVVKDFSSACGAVYVSRDGASALLAGGPQFAVVSLATGERRSLPESFRNDDYPCASADLRICALPEKDSVAIVDLVSQRTVSTIDIAPDAYQRMISLSPDGKLLAALNKDRRVDVYDTGRGKRLFTTDFRASPRRFSRDGKALLVDRPVSLDSGDTSQLELLDASTGKSIARFPAGKTWVADADLSPDGGLCLSAKGEGGLSLFNARSLGGVDIRSFDTGDWFAQDGKGRFACSDGARKFVRFVKGDAMYEAAQFWDGFYAADLFASLLAEVAAAPGPEAAPSAAASIQDAALAIPVVAIVEPAKALSVDSELLAVSVLVTDSGGKALELSPFLYRNGKTVDRGTRGISVTKKPGATQFAIVLEEGDNVIQAAAFDASGKVEGRSDRLVVTYRPARVEKPNLYLLCVGVSAYKDRNIALKAPAPDATAIAELFARLASPLYGKVSAVTLADKAASAKGIMAAFQDIQASARPQDAVIVFFAGHGIIEKEVYYFLPYETDITDLAGSALCIDDINGFVKRVPAGKIAVFLDTCQSGGATKALGAIAMSRGIEVRKTMAMLAKARGIGVLAASSASQAAYEPAELGQGLLAYALRTAVANRGEAISVDGAVSMDRLMNEAMVICGDAALKYVKVEQTPIKYMFGQDFAIGVARK